MGYAVVAVSFSMLRDLDGALPATAIGHMDGDCWVEPERRYNMAALRDALCLPKWWQPPAEIARPVVWVDAFRGLLCFLLASDSFPETPEGRYPPYIYPVLRHEWDEDLGRYRAVFDHMDMHEVENAANTPTPDCVDEYLPSAIISSLDADDHIVTQDEIEQAQKTINAAMAGTTDPQIHQWIREHTKPLVVNLNLGSMLTMAPDELRVLIREEIERAMKRVSEENWRRAYRRGDFSQGASS